MFAYEWQPIVFVASVALPIVVAGAIALTRREPLPAVTTAQVAGVAILGVLAWQMALLLPDLFRTLAGVTSGFEGTPVVLPYQGYAVAMTALVVGSAAAIVGVLRRQPWGIALGIGMGLASLVATAMRIVNFLATMPPAEMDPSAESLVADMVLGAVPAVAAVLLLAWPSRSAGRVPERDASAGSLAAPPEGVG